MTELEIKEQIDVMRSVAEKAKNSREFALKILEDAGILALIRENNECDTKSKK